MFRGQPGILCEILIVQSPSGKGFKESHLNATISGSFEEEFCELPIITTVGLNCSVCCSYRRGDRSDAGGFERSFGEIRCFGQRFAVV